MKESWHSLPLEEIFKKTKSGNFGLNSDEVEYRLKKFGPNILPSEKPYSKIRLFARQFNSPLIYILFAAVAISLFLKHYSDSIFIIVVLMINTTVGFYQENKANQSLKALKKLVKIKAWVLRDNGEKEINSEVLVIGDVLILKPGDKVPADCRIIESKGLMVNESSLTGEWLATEKKASILAKNVPLIAKNNLVFMSTIVEEGWAKVIVIAVGINTQIGDIVSLLRETEERRTPIQQKILVLSRWIGAFILFIISIVLVEGYFTGQDFTEIFVASVALAVSAIPAGLLPAITVILVFGMRRILKAKGLVRKLVASETLGSVTVICTDKTGTLTEGKMEVSHILTSTKELLSDGLNNIAKGENSNGIESHITALKIAALATDAFVENPESALEKWVVRGNPTEKALLLAGMQAGLNKKELEKQTPVIDRMSFDNKLKYSATLHKKNDKENILYIIGAPEELISKSIDLDINGQKVALGTAEADALIGRVNKLASKGFRVIACAYRHFGAGIRYKKLNDIINKTTLVGFIALKDPLRADIKKTIAITRKAGIRAVIVTGDHRLTAQTVAEEIGLDAEDKYIIEGKELDKMTAEELQEKIKYISVFARVSPRHKLQIVSAFQANGEIVAMFGDGVNDAPALKSADVGVVVGTGTDVAKEVSDLILLDDNFATIVKAIEQGRIIFENIKKVFIYLMADDFSEIFLFLASMAMGLPLPLLPAQILWINLVEDGLSDIALTTEQETEGLMEEKPRSSKESIINWSLKKFMIAIFIITGLIATLSFVFIYKLTGDLSKTRTIVFALMAVDSLTFAFNIRSLKQTVFRKDIFSNKYLNGAVVISFILLLFAVYFPPLQKILGTQALFLKEWGLIFGLAVLEMTLIAISKKIFLKYN
ncbi:MAG: HAD-IC family P-type ATPase [Candidatus Azambacteria bacterium]|nr:HAD-IC family P-type ATPase [Candidatus Azambacteria bacterium]